MVSSRSEVARCRDVVDQLVADLRATGVPYDPRIELGVMVEVPVLVPVLPEVLPLSDFVSVGTNDLVQYLLAVDRDNQRVAKMYDPFHPGVLRVLQQIAQAAQRIEQQTHRLGWQDAGRFVKDQKARFGQQAADDLHPLPFPDRQRMNMGEGIDHQPEILPKRADAGGQVGL